MTNLDRDLDRELLELPALRAPETLLPRVMAAAARLDAQPWYSRAWVTWPRSLQLLSAAVVVLAIAACLGGVPASHWLPASTASRLNRIVEPVKPIAHWVTDASTLGRVFWKVWLQPIALYLVALLIVLSLVSAGAYSLLNRITLEASPQ